VSLLGVFAVGEIWARVAFRRSDEPAVQARRERPQHDPSLPVLKGVYSLARKNVRGIHKNVYFRTNEHRFRGPDYSPHPEPGVLRVAVTGDSVTMGEGVEEELTYSARLEERWAEQLHEPPLEVINAGMSGSNIGAAMDRLRVAIDAYQPGLLIYGFTINDIEGDHYEKLGHRGDELRGKVRDNPFASSPSHLVRLLWWKRLSLQAAKRPADSWHAREIHHNYFENAKAWRDLEAGLDEFAAIVAETGRCGHVLIHTHITALGDDHPYSPVYERVRDASRARGLTVTISLPEFEDERPAELWVGFFDPHPNAKGHALLSRSLQRGLLGLPQSCLEPRRVE
jgi:lysophospholipase L1-like esterase